MLKTLSIWNFALIEHIQIEFNSGLNILTGETGAGKSILLGALGLVTGHRSNTDVIRSNADFVRVEAVFSVTNELLVKDFLWENNILTEDNTLIITRQISTSGRNIIQINNCHTTLAVLRRLGEMLVDIHGQHASQTLLKPVKQLNLIDEYDDTAINEQKKIYTQVYNRWIELKEKLAKSRINTQEIAQRLDMLNWQINEIQSAKLNIDEDIQLEEQIKILANAEKISLLSQNAYNLLYEGGNILGSLAQLRKDVETLAHYDEDMKKVYRSVEDAYFQLQDSAEQIRGFGENIDYNPQKLDSMQSRLEEINKLRRKYGSSIKEILAYCEKVKSELTYIENYDANLAQMEYDLNNITQELKQKAATLHKLRQQNASRLADDIIAELKSLSMPYADLQIKLWLSDNFTPNGADNAEFLFSANLGEEKKLLQKIVSGGELSRIALAVKTIMAQKDDVELMVFDEVDSGVGGKTAQMMAEKIARISRYRQVICITHLPQIASMADAHFYIHKETRDNKTFTDITEIDYSARLAEIARMASGTELTQASMENAEEMLATARRKKELLSV